ncbi:MAG: DUF4401 domain-containing protein [Betaproteobacteria bacterium]|nr:DUF4401 domain-containing protein [Betaproteobacteria bacterium]
MTRADLLRRLVDLGLPVNAASERLEPVPAQASWVVRSLLGVMGWLGGLMVLGFFAMFVSGLLDSQPGLAVLSVSLFVGAHALYRAAPHHDFANQAALAASICAQALAMVLFFKLMGSRSHTQVALLVAALQLGLVWWMPNYLHRLISMFFAVTALFVAAERGPWTALVLLAVAGAFAALALTESRWMARGQRDRVAPAWAGLALGLLCAGVAHATQFDRVAVLPSTIWTGMALSFAFFMYCLYAMDGVETRDRQYGGMAAMLFWMAAFRAPGLIACALVLIAAFRSGRQAFVGLALIALLGTLIGYYYQMDATLLKKSGVLALCGVAMLLAWGGHRRAYPGAKEGA